MSKFTLAAAAAAGYVFGTRAGRDRYQQIAERASAIWQSPVVQQGAARVQGAAKDKAPGLMSKVENASRGQGGRHASAQDSSGFDDNAGQNPLGDDATSVSMDEVLAQDGFNHGEEITGEQHVTGEQNTGRSHG